MSKQQIETSVTTPYCSLVTAILFSLIFAQHLPESIDDFITTRWVDPADPNPHAPAMHRLLLNGILLGLTTVAWAIFYLTDSKIRVARLFSFLSATTIWLLFLAMLLASIQFAIANNGFDRAEDGQGSPVAFLIGAFVKLVFFIPSTFLMRSTYREWRKSRAVTSFPVSA